MDDFTEQEIDLIVASVNFAYHCLGVFQDHLRFHGHDDTADFAVNGDDLRRKVTAFLHQRRD